MTKTESEIPQSSDTTPNQEIVSDKAVKTELITESQAELVEPAAQVLVKKHSVVKNSCHIKIKRIKIFLILLTFLNLLVFGFLFYQSWDSQKATNTKIDNLNELLVDSQGPLAPMLKLVADLPVDRTQFKACLQSDKFQQTVEAQLKEATNSGVQSTPTHVIFDTQTNKTRLIEGALPFETLSKELVAFQNNQPTTITTETQNPRTELAVRKPDSSQDNWKGPKEARYIWIEFVDFECPYCKVANQELQKLLDKNPDLAFVYRHFPLTQIHPNAQKLAEASECYKDQYGQNGFWLIVNKIYSN